MIATQLELGQSPRSRGRESADSARHAHLRRLTSVATELGTPQRDPFAVPAGDFARQGLVDAGFVERFVAALRSRPDAETELRAALAKIGETLDALHRVYRDAWNEWAATTRERLWMEHFTVEAILRRLAGVQASARGADQAQSEQAEA